MYEVVINPIQQADRGGMDVAQEEARIFHHAGHYWHVGRLDGGGDRGQQQQQQQQHRELGGGGGRSKPRPGLYGGRNRSSYTYRSYMNRKSGQLGGPSRPVKTVDERTVFNLLLGVTGTNFKAMNEMWKAMIAEQVGEAKVEVMPLYRFPRHCMRSYLEWR